MKRMLAAALVAAGVLAAPAAASAQVCAIGVIVAGFYTGFAEHRELTEKEAMFCGVYHEKQPAKTVKTVKAKPKKSSKKAGVQ